MKTLTIEQLADKLNGKLWIKGDIKRIYLDRGYNTKKMSTKTYVFQRQDGTFGVNCVIDCPAQHDNWIEKEQNNITESVLDTIKGILFENENPQSYEDYKESVIIEKQVEKNKKENNFASKKDNLLAVQYLKAFKRPQDYTFPTLLDYFKKCTYFSSLQYKKEEKTELEFELRPLTFNGGWAYDQNSIEKIFLPVIKTSSSNKYNYYSVTEEGLEDLLPESFKKNWIEAKEKTALFNSEIDAKITELLEGENIEVYYNELRNHDMYTKQNSDLYQSIFDKINQMKIA